MTVKQLIECLMELPQDYMVIIKGYEGGVDEIEGCEETKINININTEWYYGKHEIDEVSGSTDAVIIY